MWGPLPPVPFIATCLVQHLKEMDTLGVFIALNLVELKTELLKS